MKNIRILFCTILVLILFIQSTTGLVGNRNIAHDSSMVISEYPTDLSGIKVAVYEGYFSDLCLNSRIALFNMFSWMNATVDYLNSSQICMDEELWEYDILAVPDGLAPRFETNLGTTGLDVIRNWVDKGGSYFGVRAGGALACQYGLFEGQPEEYRLALFNGTGYGPINALDDICITTMNINSTALPTFTDIPSELQVLYRLTRYFVPTEGQEMIPIGNYDVNDETGMLAFHYGSGCVFMSGLDPEFEENSDRDGTDYRDDFNDPDSEWPLLLEISTWMVEESEWNLPEITIEATTTEIESTSITTNTSEILESPTIPMELLLIGSSVGAVAIVMIGVLVLKRR